jgi:hypothetical protein
VTAFRIVFPDPIKPEHTVADIHAAIRKSPELNDGERQLAEAVLSQALGRGTTRAADLFEELKGNGRRRIVDAARESIGMPTVDAEEADLEFKRVNRMHVGTGRDADGLAFMGCAAENCHAYPLNEMGVPSRVPDRVWWCARHKDQAGPDDHLPPEPDYFIDPATMALRAAPALQARLLKEDEERVRKAAEREQRRREEAKALAEVRDRYAEQAKPTNIGGWLVRPNGRIVDEHLDG